MRQIELSKVNKDIKVVDGKLFFGDREVEDCQFITEQSIAALYVIRVYDGRHDSIMAKYPSFVGGLDLIENRFWLGGKHINMWMDQKQFTLPSAHYDTWESVEYVLNNLVSDTAGKDWIICEEEDFEAHQQEDDPWDDEWLNEPTLKDF